MEISSQTDSSIEKINIKKEAKSPFALREKYFQSLSPVLELPSIHRNHKFVISKNSESTRLKSENAISPTRFPSIFKKYRSSVDA